MSKYLYLPFQSGRGNDGPTRFTLADHVDLAGTEVELSEAVGSNRIVKLELANGERLSLNVAQLDWWILTDKDERARVSSPVR